MEFARDIAGNFNKIYKTVKLRERLIIISALASFMVLVGFIFINRIYFNGSLLTTDLVKTVGVFSGAALGFILEERFIPFSITGSILKKLLRFIAGIGGSLLLLSGLKLIFPDLDLFHFIRYSLVGLWVTWLFPYIGLKTGLFTP